MKQEAVEDKKKKIEEKLLSLKGAWEALKKITERKRSTGSIGESMNPKACSLKGSIKVRELQPG